MKRNTGKREPDIDLALVAGLKIFIRQLAGYRSLNMLFGDLKIIEDYEKGARRRAIRYIRENVEPKTLGLRLAHPEPRGPNPGRRLAKAFKEVYAVGKNCPLCRRRKIVASADGNGTACRHCGRLMYTMPVSREYHPAVGKFLHDLHASQILSHWHGLNDPNPILFGAKAA